MYRANFVTSDRSEEIIRRTADGTGWTLSEVLRQMVNYFDRDDRICLIIPLQASGSFSVETIR